MLFQLQYYRYEPDEYFPQGQRNYYFRVSINLRGADETLYSSGECSPWEGSIFCGVDDDGGGLTIAPRGNGGITVGWDALISRLRTSVGPYEGESSPTYELTPEITAKNSPSTRPISPSASRSGRRSRLPVLFPAIERRFAGPAVPPDYQRLRGRAARTSVSGQAKSATRRIPWRHNFFFFF